MFDSFYSLICLFLGCGHLRHNIVTCCHFGCCTWSEGTHFTVSGLSWLGSHWSRWTKSSQVTWRRLDVRSCLPLPLPHTRLASPPLPHTRLIRVRVCASHTRACVRASLWMRFLCKHVKRTHHIAWSISCIAHVFCRRCWNSRVLCSTSPRHHKSEWQTIER